MGEIAVADRPRRAFWAISANSKNALRPCAQQKAGVAGDALRHLIKIASDAGLEELTAEVLPENAAMIKVFRKFGFTPAPRRDPQTLHLVRKLA